VSGNLEQRVGGRFLDLGGATVNVLHPRFGAQLQARGDGSQVVLNGADVIRAAIAFSVRGGIGAVWLPGARYRVESTIIVPSATRLHGAGQGQTRLLWYGPETGAVLQVGAAETGQTETTRSVIPTDLDIRLPEDGPRGGVGLDLRSSKWTGDFERITITGAGPTLPFDVGVRVRSYNFVNRLSRISVTYCRTGVQMDPTANTNFITHCDFRHNGIAVRLIGSLNNIAIRDSEFEGNLQHAVHATSCAGLVLDGNRFERNFRRSKDGIADDGSQVYLERCEAEIRGNYFQGGLSGAGLRPDFAVHGVNSKLWIHGNSERNHSRYFVHSVGPVLDTRVGPNANHTPVHAERVYEIGKAYGTTVRGTTSQRLPPGGAEILVFNTAELDTELAFSADRPDRLVCRRTGLFQILGVVAWPSETSGERWIGIRKNGREIAAIGAEGGVSGRQMQVSAVTTLARGDFVQIWARHDGGNDTVIAFAPRDAPTLAILRLGDLDT
jgi:hypothetical protein